MKRLVSLIALIALAATVVPLPAVANTMVPQPPIASADAPKRLVIGDVDNDGDNDVVVANYRADSKTARSGSFSVFLQDHTTGQLLPRMDFAVPYPGTPSVVRISEVSGDEGAPGLQDDTPEILVGDAFRHRVYVYKMFPGPTWKMVSYVNTISEGYGPYAMMDIDLGDVSMDNRDDLLVPAYYTAVEEEKGGYGLFRQVSSNSSLAMRAVTILDDGSVAAPTLTGSFALTRDGGSHWQEIGSPASAAFTDIAVTYNGTVVASTLNGWLMQSTDSGQTWRLIDQADATLNALGADKGSPFVYAAGSKGYYGLFDGSGLVGNNSTLVGNVTFNDLATVGEYVFFVGTSGSVIRVESGSTVETEFPDVPSRPTLLGIDEALGNPIVVGKFGALFRHDGADWIDISTGARDLNEVYMADALNGWIVGDGGTILRTTDGGLTWAPQPSSTTADLYGVTILGSKGWIVGDAGTILYTEDGGSTWQKQLINLNGWTGGIYTPDNITINPFSGRIADMNGDGVKDVALASFESGNFVTTFVGGPYYSRLGQLIIEPDSGLAPGLRAVAVDDLNNDGLNDVAGVAFNNGKLTVGYQNAIGWPINGVETQMYSSGASTFTAPTDVTIGDVSKDGLNDVIIANSYNGGIISGYEPSGTVSVFMQNRKTFRLDYIGEYEVGGQPAGVAVGDVDSDGAAEIIVTNNTEDTIQVLDYGLPLPPYISSLSHAEQDRYYGAIQALFKLTAPADFDGIEGFRYIIDREPATVPTSGASFSPDGTINIKMDDYAARIGASTPDGTWYIHAVSLDSRGNLGTQASHYKFMIDRSGPTVPVVDDGVSGWTNHAYRRFTWTPSTDALSGLARYWISVNGAAETSISPAITEVDYTDLPDGKNFVSVRAEDKAGNFSAKSFHEVFVDAGSPSASVTRPSVEKGLVGGTYWFGASATDRAGVYSVQFLVDGVSIGTDRDAPYEMSYDIKSLSTGTHTLKVIATDFGGNKAEAIRQFVADNTAPKISSISDTPDPFFPILLDKYKDSAVYKYSVSEASTMYLKIYTSAGALVRTVTATKPAGAGYLRWDGANASGVKKAGTYYYRITAKDTAGNTTTSAKYPTTIKAYEVVRVGDNAVKIIPR